MRQIEVGNMLVRTPQELVDASRFIVRPVLVRHGIFPSFTAKRDYQTARSEGVRIDQATAFVNGPRPVP
jgi:formyltetrahydrofolate hydrolase